MAVALSIFGIAFAAFCIWLVVRVTNRRERWAIAGLVLLLVYTFSFWPVCWAVGCGWGNETVAGIAYFPMLVVPLFLPDAMYDAAFPDGGAAADGLMEMEFASGFLKVEVGPAHDP